MANLPELQAAVTGLRTKQIFFVCGAAKSGTTWLQALLDAHPNVVCSGEAHFANQLLPALQSVLSRQNRLFQRKHKEIAAGLRAVPPFRPEHGAFLLGAAISLLLGEQAADPSVLAVGDKTPDNIRSLPLLQTLFPRAKFIHIVRDGRDGAVSCWFHNERLRPVWAHEKFARMEDFVAHYAKEWAQSVDAGLSFGARAGAHYHRLRYEDLLAEPDGTAQRLFAFIGVPGGNNVVAECCARAAFPVLSGGRARGQEDRASFFRNGIAGDWRNHLSAEGTRLFEAAAGQWLDRLGYGRAAG